MMKGLWTGLLDLVFPRNCLLCRRYASETAHDPVCPACHAHLPYNHPPFCVCCSRHLNVFTAQGLCPDCLNHPPHFDMAWGFTLYEPPMSQMIKAFKFHNKTALRKTFRTIAETFLDRYQLSLNTFDLIIPMPLSTTRLRERGYNQALLFAEVLSELLSIPIAKDYLVRQRHTSRQSDLRSKERWTNIQGAFTMSPSSEIHNRCILLVDDLLTTGATASEAAQTMKNSGAKRVGVIVLSIA